MGLDQVRYDAGYFQIDFYPGITIKFPHAANNLVIGNVRDNQPHGNDTGQHTGNNIPGLNLCPVWCIHKLPV